MSQRRRTALCLLFSSLATLVQADCSYQQITRTSVPQGPNFVPPANLISATTDQLQIDWHSPLVYANNQDVFARTMNIIISAPAIPGQAMPNANALNSACKRQYNGQVNFSALPSPLSFEDCKVVMPYRELFDNVMQHCSPRTTEYHQDGNAWQLVELEAWVRWRDYDENGQVAFDTNMNWPLAFRMQLSLNQSANHALNVTDPYVDKSFTIVSSSLQKTGDGFVSMLISYSLKTVYPFKPKAHDPIMQFPLAWTPEAKISALANMDSSLILHGASCDSGTPRPGEECVSSGEISFTFDSALQCDPTGKFTFLFDVDCTAYMPDTVSSCSDWGLLSQNGPDLQTVFYIASGTDLCAMITTDNLVPQQSSPPASVANNYGQNSRVSFKSKLALPIPYARLQLKDFNMTQEGTENSWELYAAFTRLTFANDTEFEFSYDGPYNDTDLTSSFKLLYGANKTSAITTAADDGHVLSFTAAVTIRLFFDPYGRAPARRLRYRDTTIGGDDLLLSTDATAQAGFEASVVASEPGQFDNVTTVVPNSFEITEFSYYKEGVNTTLVVGYELKTKYPYLLSEWNDVLVLPQTWSQDAKDATQIRYQYAIQSQVWSDTPVLANSTCLHSGVLRAVFPTSTICDPAGSYGLTFNQSCFTGDSGDCLRYGQELSTSLTAFVLSAGVNLCASASETIETTITRAFAPEEGIVPVGNQAHLWTRFTTPKKVFAALVDSVIVEQVDTAYTWTLQTAGTATAFSNKVAFSWQSSYSGSKLQTTIDVRFTPNIGTSKGSSMIVLDDRSGNVQFRVTMTTKLYFDSVKAAQDGLKRRLLYEERTIVRAPTKVLAREVKQTVPGPKFQGTVVFGTTEMQVASVPTKSMSTGTIAGIAVVATACVLTVIGAGVYYRRTHHLGDASTLPHIRQSSGSDRTSEDSTYVRHFEEGKGNLEHAHHRQKSGHQALSY
jgi:hypothetical protein